MDNIPVGLHVDDTLIKISPLVPSIILNYHNTRNAEKGDSSSNSNNNTSAGGNKGSAEDHSLGVLLGNKIGNTIMVTNAFGTKYISTEPYIDKSYVKFMKKYLTKNTDEVLVGMFYVSNESQEFNNIEFLTAYNAINLLLKSDIKAIILTMDASASNQSLNLRTFSQLDYNLGTTNECLAVFNDVPYEIIIEDDIEVGYDNTGLHGQEIFDTLSLYWRQATNSESLTMDKFDELKEMQKLFSTTEKLKINISYIAEMLNSAMKYVDDVVNGKISGDPEIGRALSSCLSKISDISFDSIETLLRDHYQDLLTLSKLTNQIKTQLSTSFSAQSEGK